MGGVEYNKSRKGMRDYSFGGKTFTGCLEPVYPCGGLNAVDVRISALPVRNKSKMILWREEVWKKN